jgi:hypothetical protein
MLVEAVEFILEDILEEVSPAHLNWWPSIETSPAALYFVQGLGKLPTRQSVRVL